MLFSVNSYPVHWVQDCSSKTNYNVTNFVMCWINFQCFNHLIFICIGQFFYCIDNFVKIHLIHLQVNKLLDLNNPLHHHYIYQLLITTHITLKFLQLRNTIKSVKILSQNASNIKFWFTFSSFKYKLIKSLITRLMIHKI